MDHDAVPFGISGPRTHRISDLREAYRRYTEHGLVTMTEKIAAERAYASNDAGHFAWDVSYLVRAACIAWRATGDSSHLRRAANWAQHMVGRTDEARGVEDWRGRSAPVWSAGSRYTAGTAVVGEVGGVPLSLQAMAAGVRIERPSSGTAIIHTHRPDGSGWSSPEGSLLPGEKDYLPDVLARRSGMHSVLLRGLPAPVDLTSLPAGDHSLQEQIAPHLVHTGLIARALIEAAATIEDAARDGVTTEVEAEELYSAALRALLVHDDEIRTRSGQSWYVTPEDFPTRRLGLELPHNHVVDAATSFLLLGRRRGDAGLESLGTSLTRRFLKEITAYDVGELRHPWFYYPVDADTFSGVSRSAPMAERSVPPVARGEDSSHATMRVRALLEWRAFDRDLVPDQALSVVALAFRRFFMARRNGMASLRWLPGDDNDSPRFGHSDTFSGAWGALAPWDATIKRRINSMAYRHPPTTVFGATVISAAEILALNTGTPTCASWDRTSRG